MKEDRDLAHSLFFPVLISMIGVVSVLAPDNPSRHRYSHLFRPDHQSIVIFGICCLLVGGFQIVLVIIRWWRINHPKS